MMAYCVVFIDKEEEYLYSSVAAALSKIFDFVEFLPNQLT